MSYCVNCGVELGGGLKECPLCNTPVINPKELEEKAKMPAFPTEKGQVETVKRHDMGLLITIVAVAASVTCLVLNLLVYDSSLWSLAVIGACAMLWVMVFPVLIYRRFPVYVYLLFDGLMLAVYLYMITYVTAGSNWFWQLGLPMIVLLTVVVELFALCEQCLPKGFLPTALYLFTAIGVLCCGLEVLIDLYAAGKVVLRWSAVVVTVCVIIDAAIITVLSKKRFRNALRRRLHF